MQTHNLERTLAAKRISPTAMRLRVLEYLVAREAAVSLADVEKGLSHTDRITVYRTLKTFEEHHLVHSIEDGTGATKYALCAEECRPDTPHHDLHIHFHCRQCDETTCLPSTVLPALQLPEAYTAEEMSLTVQGICNKCNHH
ncbi:Fur family transcriptional regulator [Taibaiella koreensis]|uniref:Fur family transcriptional regulator n=1 Tax=Taibaiella koreensis TaxID=1268548 RepID=UPI000E59BBE8|nr:transcriptional repressor [Taibaiella koreensis]